MLKKSIVLIFIVLLALLISSILVLAGGFDDRGNSNDPAVNDRANACYEAGTLAGKCDSDLEWQAGWYLIRYEFGIFERYEIPEWVEWVLPPETLPDYMSPVSPGGSCSPGAAVCPNLTFSCAQLFSCAEACACLQGGNLTLDSNGDNIPCNEPGNLLSGAVSCN